jgi:AcrR family transcriptional regulator
MRLVLPSGPTYHKRIGRSTYPPPDPRPLRRDARENRERILVAAHEAFAELGLDAGVEEIAFRAGVGMGTLYRRFPTKDALIDAVFEGHLDRLAGSAEAALEEPDPWQGLLGYLAGVVRLQSSDRGFSEVLGAHLRSEQLLTRARTRIRPLVEELVLRAQAAGSLRPDVAYEDISVILWTTGRVVDATRDVEPQFWQRYLALVVDGLRTESASPLPRPPLTPAKHSAAMQRFMQERGRGPSPADPLDA